MKQRLLELHEEKNDVTEHDAVKHDTIMFHGFMTPDMIIWHIWHHDITPYPPYNHKTKVRFYLCQAKMKMVKVESYLPRKILFGVNNFKFSVLFSASSLASKHLGSPPGPGLLLPPIRRPWPVFWRSGDVWEDVRNHGSLWSGLHLPGSTVTAWYIRHQRLYCHL